MQPVSTSYNPYPDTRKVLLRVKFGLVDVAAAADATPAASEQNSISQLSQITNGAEGMSERYGTLEHNQFLLDGTVAMFPDNPAAHQMGWWSAQISDSNGNFATYPTLTFNFSADHSSIGFTPIFDDKMGEYCTDFSIQTYDASNNLLTSIDVTGNTLAYCPVTLNTDNYRKVVFVFKKTNHPGRFVRISQVLFGIIQYQTGDNTASAELIYEISPVMESAPANEFNVTIDNSDRRYNLINPDGLYRYLQSGQPLDVEMAVGAPGAEEYVNMGRSYYDQSVSADSSLTATITGYTPLYFMTGKYRKGRIGTTTVKAFVAEIFADAGWLMVVNDIGGVGDRIIKTQCDIVEHREAVRLAAQAARCMCIITRDNTVLLVDTVIGEPTDTLTLDNQSDYPAVKQSDRVTTVEVTTEAYAADESGQELYSGSVSVSGTVTKWFDYKSPAQSAAATVTGATLVSAEYYLHAAKLTITGSGTATVTITGTTMDSTETIYSAQEMNDGETEQIKDCDNTLCNDGQALAGWLLAYYRYAYSYAVQDRGNPAREVGDSVRIYDKYGEHRVALATKIQLSYDGGLSCNMDAIGGIVGA